MTMITDSQANVLISFWYGADLSQVDLDVADAVAKTGLVAWSYTAFKTDTFVMPEGVDALIEWLADDDLARWMGLLPAVETCPVTVRSGSLPEMNVTVRLFDEGVEARCSGDRVAYRRACRADDEGCAWAKAWLRGWMSVGEMAVAS
jgi:hypothetical protein